MHKLMKSKERVYRRKIWEENLVLDAIVECCGKASLTSLRS